jgi:NADPH-dependent glutamate synthase beta subunit-like oxidoreductase
LHSDPSAGTHNACAIAQLFQRDNVKPRLIRGPRPAENVAMLNAGSAGAKREELPLS